MKKETFEMMGIFAGILAGLFVLGLIFAVAIWSFPGQIFAILGLADNCLQWAAERQIPVWIIAFTLPNLISNLIWKLRWQGIRILR